MVLEVHVQVFLCDKLFTTILLSADKIFHCLTVAEHVFLNRLLGLVLGTTKVTYMELRFLGPCHDFCHNLSIFWSSPTSRKLAEVYVKPIHCVHPAVAGKAFELGECRAVLAMLEGAFSCDIFTTTVLTHCPPFHILLHILHQLLIFNLVVLVLFTFVKQFEVLFHSTQATEALGKQSKMFPEQSAKST